jgi:translation initiation factor 4G
MQQDFQQQQYGPYQAPFGQQPYMQYGPPASPQPPFRQHQYMNPGFQPPGGPQTPMSRTSSHNGIDRPPSTLAHPSTPSQAPLTPGPGSNSPAPTQSNFTRLEPRKSKAIVIKTPDGGVVDVKKEVAVKAPTTAPQSHGPVIVSSGAGVPSSSTPPPRAQATTPQHVRTESQQAKSAEEKKAEFLEAVKRNLEADKAEEVKKEAEKAQKDKDAAERKVKEEEAAAKAIEDAAKEKEAADAKAAGPSPEEVAARKKQEEDEEMERMIAEMEAAEKEEEERQAAYEKKKAAEKAAKAAAEAANADEELKRLEREAEAREEAKLKGTDANDSDAEASALFAKLKKNTQFGPSAGADISGTSTPRSASPAPPVQPVAAIKPAVLKATSRPAALKLETKKPIEPAQPTAGMNSLKSARFLEIKNEAVKYPEGIQSPNPSINQTARSQGRRYDKSFLLQFQPVFKEKPSIDWDKVVKDTVGDSSDSARPGSARTPSMGGRQLSNRPGGPSIGLGAMGQFAGSGPRTLPPGTTSEQRFQQASIGGAPRAGAGGIPAAFGQFAPGRGGFPMAGATGMARTPSSQSMSGQGMNSPRNASQRGKGSRRGANPAQENEMRKKMPLTANLDIAPLEVSKTGWKPASIVAPQQSQPLPGGHMAPDMVQRKVKAALNKMTPEKFDKIAGDILAISSQSKDEADGRTLRQVIQLTFEKACDEAHWASMYAKFCKRMLETMSADIRDENVRDKNGAPVVGGALFRKYLLNRCQEEFERGWEVNLPAKPEGETEEAAMLSDGYYVAAAAKRKGLGLIQFIGELYKLNMLTLRIMHECVIKLLNFQGTPDETAVESLVKLLKTIGMTMDGEEKGRQMITTYMDRISAVRDQEGLPSRVYYMLLDITDLRKKNWQSKDNEKGPKTIQEIHVEAQKAAQAADHARNNAPRGGPNRPQMGRGDARSASYGMPPPQDYQRNTVGMDDLKKLARGARNTSSGPSALGPTSLLGNRSSSGRRGLGPMSRGDDSGASSRTGTPPIKEKPTSTAHLNAYE